ncbi:MAG: maleylpyruvate isomerase N-terminal domain-containing protein [bacterium]|nr:maleylpyruvate isomerase N-terminal domain-containing protein [bacterium]
MDFIAYLKALKPKDWEVMVTDKWTVKDLVAHLIGWEKECSETFDKVITTGKQPWFMETDNYDEFNARSVEFYNSYSPEELIIEWQSWQSKLEGKIQTFGADKIRKSKNLNYLFDEGVNNHNSHHLKQIQAALKNKNT